MKSMRTQMAARVFLGLMALLSILYGLSCLFNPGVLESSAGISSRSITGIIELQATYGGLQIAIGVLCALGAWSKAYENTALTALLFSFAGLAVVRVGLGLFHGDYSDYNVFAMIFETACLLFLVWYFWPRTQKH